MDNKLKKLKEDITNAAADMQIIYAKMKQKYPDYEFDVTVVLHEGRASRDLHSFDIKAFIKTY